MTETATGAIAVTMTETIASVIRAVLNPRILGERLDGSHLPWMPEGRNEAGPNGRGSFNRTQTPVA